MADDGKDADEGLGITLYLPISQALADKSVNEFTAYRTLPPGHKGPAMRISLFPKKDFRRLPASDTQTGLADRVTRKVVARRGPITVLRDGDGAYYFSLDDPGRGLLLDEVRTVGALAMDVWDREMETVAAAPDSAPEAAKR